MPTEPEPWHPGLEESVRVDLGEESLRCRWYPLPPSREWMVMVDDGQGKRRGVLITNVFQPLNEMFFQILEEEASGASSRGETIWVALRAGTSLGEEFVSRFAALGARVIPCDDSLAAQPACAPATME